MARQVSFFELNKKFEEAMYLLTETSKEKLKGIWTAYISSNKKVLDTKGNEYKDIDNSRIAAIKDIKKIISDFFRDKLNLYEFKTNLDSYNKRNNYWGFTAAKGQMFFNLLTRSSENEIANFTGLLKKVISEPADLKNGLQKMEDLFEYTNKFQNNTHDKRKLANPKSVAYFLSYFWQIHDHEKWPVMYSSIITSFQQLGIWKEMEKAHDNYRQFFTLHEEIRHAFQQFSQRPVSNWDIEHALWSFAGTVTINSKQPKKKEKLILGDIPPQVEMLNAGFELNEYLIPKVCKLVELGAANDKSAASKGKAFEQMVGEVFHLLDFEVEQLGQGTGREPDAILRFPEEHVAFIVDAKAYAAGYSLGTDDRAIKEYINFYCPRLRQQGYNKIGFIIVANSFKSDLNELINNITWTTDIKRFILLTTEALLYMLAYKTKDRLTLNQMIDSLISYSTIVTREQIIEEFGDF